MHVASKKGDQRGGIGGGYGSNAQPSHYTLGHGDPLWRRTGMGAEMPTLHEMTRSYPGITKEKYAEMMRSEPYLPKHHLRPKGEGPKGEGFKPSTTLGGPFDEQVKNGLDLAEQERINSLKYRVKKPADKWFHAMDDSRITGDQIRTTNFRGSMFDRDQAA